MLSLGHKRRLHRPPLSAWYHPLDGTLDEIPGTFWMPYTIRGGIATGRTAAAFLAAGTRTQPEAGSPDAFPAVRVPDTQGTRPA